MKAIEDGPGSDGGADQASDGGFIAHSINEQGMRHGLVEHLRAVGGLAESFAAPFGAGNAAWALGMAHDVGKYAAAFQAYLAACERGSRRRRGPDHKTAGIAVVLEQLEGLGPLLALVVKGHHGGLQTPQQLEREFKVARASPHVIEALQRAEELIGELKARGPVRLPTDAIRNEHTAELFIRMVFSAVVDADYLDTERHFRGERPRSWDARDFERLWAQLEASQARMSGRRHDEVGLVRDEVYRACYAAAERQPGVFRLTVPTGGGKTRSGMVFAVRHALLHGQRQVIVAVPYVSITEQTAETYREIWEQPADDARVVLEHHHAASALRAGDDEDEEDFDPVRVWARLAAENWDAPVVVTTVVELFESIFARTTHRLRKLHRLANSVLIIDEAQALPAGLLAPILDVLQELARSYHTTVVLCTATQPAFELVPEFASAAPVEIAPDPAALFRRLSRVGFERLDDLRPQPWETIAGLMRREQQVLTVVNTRRDAVALLKALDDPNAPKEERPLHLSTMLCGSHRSQALDRVRQRLREGRPCRVVSTQVVEAGVDLDFPVVLRAMGPLDSIIQAAGRCNREGRTARGRVIVFQPAEERLPKGPYRVATQATRTVLARDRPGVDVDSPELVGRYFRQVFALVDPDQHEIQASRASLDFPEVERRFRIIGPTASVAVPYGSEEQREQAAAAVSALRSGARDARHQMRRLQPFLVSLSLGDAARLKRLGKIALVAGSVYEWLGKDDEYHDDWGLTAVAVPPEDDVLLV